MAAQTMSTIRLSPLLIPSYLPPPPFLPPLPSPRPDPPFPEYRPLGRLPVYRRLIPVALLYLFRMCLLVSLFLRLPSRLTLAFFVCLTD